MYLFNIIFHLRCTYSFIKNVPIPSILSLKMYLFNKYILSFEMYLFIYWKCTYYILFFHLKCKIMNRSYSLFYLKCWHLQVVSRQFIVIFTCMAIFIASYPLSSLNNISCTFLVWLAKYIWINRNMASKTSSLGYFKNKWAFRSPSVGTLNTRETNYIRSFETLRAVASAQL